MEEDTTQYYCDEWNLEIKEFKNINSKYFIENFRQLKCRCDLPKPNSFTGNCLNCNLIIKPIR